MINDISRVFQILLKYFNGTIIYIMLLLPVWPDQQNQQLQHYHLKPFDHFKIINYLMFLNNFHYMLLNYTLELLSLMSLALPVFMVCFIYPISKWDTIFKCYLFICIICRWGCSWSNVCHCSYCFFFCLWKVSG